MVRFNFSFQPGMSLQQMIGFEMAGRIWGTYLTDNVTINLHIGTASLGANILGGALPGFKTNQNYSDFRNQFIADKTSSDDQAAWESMFPNQYQLQRTNLSVYGSNEYNSDRVFFNAYDIYLDSALTYSGKTDWFSDIAHGRVVQKDGISYGRWETRVASPTMALTRANAKALGIDVSATSSTLDGYIVLSNLTNNPGVSWNYDFTRSSVTPSNTVDFLSTALHEIGHTLGFVSGVDRPNFPSPFFQRSNSPDGSLENLWGTSVYSNYWWSLVNRVKQATPLDLMRYSIESMNGWTQRGFQDSSMGGYYGNLFLSLDGVNSLGSLAEGKDIALTGDGSQASHWKEEAISQGLMDSHMALGERAQLSSRDLRAFDALGWNRNFSSVTLNYSTLLSQARQALANRIGRTITWMNANQTIAADLLDQDRLSDVNLMLSNSADIYEGRRNTTTGSWQELFSLLDEQGLMDTLDNTSSQPAQATVGNDLLAGSTTDDELSGLRGNDQMIGFKGNDTLRGNKGEDTLFGSLGRDLLIGGKGDDTLIGGAGADIFAVQRNAGFDVVEDFTDGQDKLLLLGGLQFEQLGIQQKGQDTLISYEGNSLMLLKNLDATLITSADIALQTLK